ARGDSRPWTGSSPPSPANPARANRCGRAQRPKRLKREVMATINRTVDTGTAHRRNAGFIASTITITRRSALRYARTPQLIVMATLQMSLFFLIYRYMFAGAMRPVGIPYADFLVPGFIATGVLFSGIAAA